MKRVNSFERAFPELKAEVQTELSSSYGCEEEEQNVIPGLSTVPQSPPSHDRHLREHLAMLELDFMEFKELIQARLDDSTYDSVRLLKEELQQLKIENQTTISQLQHTIQTIQHENNSLRAQIVKMEEDTSIRERTLRREISLMKERLEMKQTSTSDTKRTISTQTDLQPTSPSTSKQHLHPQTHTANKPTTTQHTIDTQTHTSSPPACPTTKEPLPSQKPTTSESQVVLLMDSNGKFLDPERLFPGECVTTKRCSNTNQALRLLNQDTLGRPSCIIIHTGTNDLHSLRHGTAEAMTKVAAKANREFPDSRIVMSTLLPRTDTPPHVIHNINSELTRKCSSFPNVHVAHHPMIGPRELYDGLHLHKNGVRMFARTLKDVALGRNNCPPYITRHPPPPIRHNGYNTFIRGHLPQQSLSPHMETPQPTTRRGKPSSANITQVPQQQLSYAEAAAQRTSASHQPSDLGEIRHLLQKLCAGLLDL